MVNSRDWKGQKIDGKGITAFEVKTKFIILCVIVSPLFSKYSIKISTMPTLGAIKMRRRCFVVENVKEFDQRSQTFGFTPVVMFLK